MYYSQSVLGFIGVLETQKGEKCSREGRGSRTREIKGKLLSRFHQNSTGSVQVMGNLENWARRAKGGERGGGTHFYPRHIKKFHFVPQVQRSCFGVFFPAVG